MATFVLVHGAWHGGWCWNRLTPLLKASGHDVYTPTLTGLGERSHLINRETNLGIHVKDVVNTLEFEDLKHAILVGHSYAGMVITGVANQVPERLSHLAYLDAVTPGDGKSFLDCVGPNSFRRLAAETGDGWLIRFQTGWGTMGVTGESDVSWWRERLTPQPLAAFEEKVHFRNPDALSIPKTLIWCSGSDPSEKRDLSQAWFSGSLPSTFPDGWGLYEIRAGHMAMLAAPDELAMILNELAKGS